MPRLLLASGSPRRRELIRSLSDDVRVASTDVDESVPDGTPPDVMVRDVALRKAAAAALDPAAVVVAADTTVSIDGAWLGKPEDADDARTMLTRLQGRAHQVFTGVAVAVPGADPLTDVTMTVVAMAPMSIGEIDAYVATGHGLDKAGAYGIQGTAGTVVAGIEGCYTNVVGLPLCTLAVLLARAGVAVDAPAPACAFRSDRVCPHPIWRGVAG